MFIVSWYRYDFQDRVLHIFVHTLLPVTGWLQGATYLVCGTVSDGSWLRLTMSSPGHLSTSGKTCIQPNGSGTRMKIGCWIIHFAQLGFLGTFDILFMGVYSYSPKQINLLQIMFIFTIDLDLMFLDYCLKHTMYQNSELCILVIKHYGWPWYI